MGHVVSGVLLMARLSLPFRLLAGLVVSQGGPLFGMVLRRPRGHRPAEGIGPQSFETLVTSNK